MTTVEILFRYAQHPSDAAMQALGDTREVYGIRRVTVDRAQQTIRVEYDLTRFSRAVVAQLLRRAGINLVEELPLIPPQPEAPPAEAPSQVK